MNDENNTPLAYRFRLRMQEILDKAIAAGVIQSEDWDPYVLGYDVFGGDSLLREDPALVADLVGYELGGSGVTEGDLTTITRGMKARWYNDEFF